jgi:hypothetical protein
MAEDWLKFIPLDKSWIIRMGILDLVNGYSDINNFLEEQESFGSDLSALKRVIENWNSQEIDVGESGTIYRFVRFYDWKNKIKRKIVKRGTLESRKTCVNPEIVHWAPEKLLELDNGTSQWATMAYLLGNRRKVSNPPFKLKVTYDAVEYWEKQRKEGRVWESRPDITLYNQVLAFVNLLQLKSEKIDFKPEQAEDYCFARAFGLIEWIEGEKRFPSLRGHETDRIEEMEEQLAKYEKEEEIDSKDHRVIQAIVMKALADRKEIKIKYQDSVNKTWPKFWEFIDYCKNIK